ncbi:Prolipoprotein diacylglyceryl transferase [Calidithermus terrae]|uniref:Phosphatidylglycerol--prolipoprotein diacylglyceryl transferase n=1 Tax=Calidithermus terrae TaxID=1408545 RepID=A0A399E6D0_9DEIN|nr:prolipoprotein diacylglyceryl transferase [Calidithermus terrae]RIH77512.1 Prolipoprotein diacylglyceryl transferase [Calidithermus terrae]
MDPIMIEIGPIQIRWYGFFLVVAIFAGFEIAKRYLRGWGYDPDRFEQAAFWAVVAGVIGARLGYVLTSPSDFADNPISALYIWQGGLSIHGALIVGILAFWLYSRRYGTPFMPYLEASLPAVALGVIAGRLGNFMNGSDTVGRLTTLPIGFTWPESASGFPGLCKAGDVVTLAYGLCLGEVVRGPVHLTQIYGAVIGVVLTVLVVRWLAMKKPWGYAFWQFVLWYSVLRSVFEETFRLNPLWVRVYENNQIGVGLFTATQIFSIPLIILAIVMLYRLPRGTREAVAVPVNTPPKADKAEAKPRKKG